MAALRCQATVEAQGKGRSTVQQQLLTLMQDLVCWHDIMAASAECVLSIAIKWRRTVHGVLYHWRELT